MPTKTLSIEKTQYVPMRVVEVELSQPLPILSTFDERTEKDYQKALCLVRLHTQPLGTIEIQLPEKGAYPQDYAESIWQKLKGEIIEHLQAEGSPLPQKLDAQGIPSNDMPRCLEKQRQVLEDPPFVSVIVPTHNRPEHIVACLSSLTKLQYPQYEILIVDNAPTTTATADFIRESYGNDPRVRYFLEERLGSSRARNHGMLEARGDILAFTDDDVVVDAHWLTELVSAFKHADKVACIVGYVHPLRLDTPAQLWGEALVKVEDGEKTKFSFKPRITDSKMRHTHLYTLGTGNSANMATTATFLRSIGGFDPALGPGTPTQGAEDIEILLQTNMHGYTVVYNPAAIIYHHHRASVEDVLEQLYAFGLGYGAFLTQSVIRYPQLLLDLARQIFHAITTKKPASSAKQKKGKKAADPASEVVPLLLRGLLTGPFAYIQSAVLQKNRRSLQGNHRPAESL